MGAMLQQIGRYEIIRELGRGSMGIVYAAIDPLIGRMVAIKTIRLDEHGDAEARAELTRRLYREAQSAGILSHPGIITIHDVGERGNVAYIVMEYVDGTNLEEVLSSGVPQHSDTLLSILGQAAAALDYAHSKGIIHRDIKPSNIMICRNGAVKIADFGVAKLSASNSMTQAGLVLGTPSYMSPEQAQGLAISGRTDQFSLAVVAYRALTGTLPFQGPTLTALLTKILMEEPHYESAGLPAHLQPIFRKALSKDPEARHQSCADFIHELGLAYTSRKVEASESAPVPEASADSDEKVKALPESDRPAPSGNLPDFAASAPVRALDSADTKIPPAEAPEEPAEAPKRKSPRFALAACLAMLALAALAFFGFRLLHKPGSLSSNLQTDAAAAFETKTTQPDRAQTHGQIAGKPAAPDIRQAKPKAITARAPSELQQAATQKPEAALPQPAETAGDSAHTTTGTVIWTGRLDRNSVLVITQRQASVGSVVGELPGVPVSVEPDPADLVVRQMPGPENQWKQIILYSGPSRYRSITLYWKTLR
jgi:serine/threonine protein kinase